MATETRAPDDGELLALLNSAFDGWGSERYFEWKYGAFPEYEPATDNFVVTNESGDLVGARRIFRRRLRTSDGGTASVHVHGGTVVDEDHRGRGHYSALLDRSMDFSAEHADYVVTFNRAGKLTTDHHLADGWNHLVLPVRTKVLSPSRVLSHYVLDGDLASTAAAYASRVDRRLTRSTGVSRALASAASFVYGGSDGDGDGDGDSGIDRDDHEPERTGLPASASSRDDAFEVDVVDGRDLSDGLVDELSAHLRSRRDGHYRFERSPATVRHAGRYPDATAYLARDVDGELRGAVVAGYLEKGDLLECRVVEQTWAEPAATRRLFECVEDDARGARADVLVACSRRRPGPGWIGMGTEYMMWPLAAGADPLPASPDAWRLTAYDVL